MVLVFVVSLLLAGGGVSAAYANGRFPAASLMAFHPTDPKQFAVGTTFGLIETRDGADSFNWSCEFVLGASDGEDIALAVTRDGGLVAGTLTGLVTSADGCAYSKVAEFQNEVIVDLALSRATASSVFAVRSRGQGAGLFDAQVLRSDDQGQSWARLPALPVDLLPVTIDVAPSDPERVYLTARTNADADFSSVLLRSEDGGESFQSVPLPETSGQRLAFIAAVHPEDEGVLYLRVDDPAGTVIWRSTDAGENFQRLFTGAGRLLGFALSPAGDQIALGGAGDGLWLGGADGTDLQRRSDLAPTCLGWNETGLYACADATLDGFSLGRSLNEAASFEPLLKFSDLCGASQCESALAQQCQFDWELTAPALGARCGLNSTPETPDAGTPPTNAGQAAAGGTDEPASRGGTCAFMPRSADDRNGALLGAALLLLLAYRRLAPTGCVLPKHWLRT